MNKNLQKRLDKIVESFKVTQNELNSTNISTEKRIELSKKFSSLEQVVNKKNTLEEIKKNLVETEGLLNDNLDEELVEMAKEDIKILKRKLDLESSNLQKLLIPKDEDDEKDAIVEIRAGTGGDEAALFSMVLLRMYQKYGELNKWKFEILNFQETNIGGCKEAILSFSGKNVFSSLKYE